MKIIHFADLHIGVESYSRTDPVTGFPTRLLDILNSLDTLVEYAINQNVDLVLFCGDTYKTRDPSQTQQREFAKRLRKLSEANVTVFLLVGNHDLPNAIGKANAIEIFHTLAVKNIYVGNSLNVYRVPTKSGEVQIASLPWPRRSALVSREDTKNLSIGDTNKKIEEAITAGLAGLIEKIDSSLPAILAAHVSVASAKQGSEKTMVVGRDPVILLSSIAQTIFDYVALGHIHRNQILNIYPPVVYSGSLERLDFGDENLQKGFYVIDIKAEEGKKNISYTFQQVEARKFLTISILLESTDLNPTTTILKEIEKEHQNLKQAIVKLQLTLPRSMEASIKEAEIYKALQESYYVFIAKEFQQETRPVLGVEAIEELTPLEVLKIYLESKNIAEQRVSLLLDYGEKLIREISGNEG